MRFHFFIVPLSFVQGYKNLQTRHDNISCSYHTLLFVQASFSSMYILNPMHLLHFKDILIILIRQTTNITDSKQIHLNSCTAWTDRVQSMQYVSFNDTDVLYHVSIIILSK